MGTRGPLKLVDAGAPTETAQAVVPALAPTKPAGVAADEELSILWDEVVPELDKAGLLTPADVAAVEVMLRHVLLVRMAHRAVMETGTVIVPAKGEDVEKKHPAEAIMRLESAHVLEWSKQLGMTWMSRARTAAPSGGRGKDEGENPFAAPASGE